MKKIDLKPCPHCGEIKIRIDNDGFYGGSGMKEKPDSYWAMCSTCFASGGPGGTRKEAAENWNRRTP
jgi:Lar family restriction alleviation protein